MSRIPVIFIHGMWMHATSWDTWLRKFREAGYEPVAPGWPGESSTVAETRSKPEALRGVGIDAIVDAMTRVIREHSSPPIVIGHSLGGLVAERLFGTGLTRACIAITPAPVRGVIGLSLPLLKVSFSMMHRFSNRNNVVVPEYDQFRSMFANTRSVEESKDIFDRYQIPSPGKPLFEAALAVLNPRSPAIVRVDERSGPLLVIVGGKDQATPRGSVYASYRKLRSLGADAEIIEFPDRDHSLIGNRDWGAVADRCLEWLRAKTG